jgi:hypothetical protein
VGSVVMTADKSMPERQQRKWEKKAEGGGGDDE